MKGFSVRLINAFSDDLGYMRWTNDLSQLPTNPRRDGPVLCMKLIHFKCMKID